MSAIKEFFRSFSSRPLRLAIGPFVCLLMMALGSTVNIVDAAIHGHEQRWLQLLTLGASLYAMGAMILLWMRQVRERIETNEQRIEALSLELRATKNGQST